ncbi:hypothetical protein [Salinimicrobium xinjiangense]|uniref:hypothetical protein n=1 Tax=Salinimicrobium xinjiangense TaxID=438596 RepID=UPI00049024BC|nr:hypothetical protein [Salinimicrobium xinjiangense]
MKKLIFMLLSALFLVGCQNVTKQEKKGTEDDPLFETTFKDYRDLKYFEKFEKISDNSINLQNSADGYRLMELKEKNNHLILFYKLSDSEAGSPDELSYLALDTLQLPQLQEDERVTIGYCYHDDYNEGEVIAVVKETDSLHVTHIVKAWRASAESESIEKLADHKGIKCLNEFFERENATIPFEKIS